jgi:hypothetical protein
MPGDQPSAEETPSADVLKERVDKLGAETNLGAGDNEPDPATADNPPQSGGQGDRARDPD